MWCLARGDRIGGTQSEPGGQPKRRSSVQKERSSRKYSESGSGLSGDK